MDDPSCLGIRLEHRLMFFLFKRFFGINIDLYHCFHNRSIGLLSQYVQPLWKKARLQMNPPYDLAIPLNCLRKGMPCSNQRSMWILSAHLKQACLCICWDSEVPRSLPDTTDYNFQLLWVLPQCPLFRDERWELSTTFGETVER